MNINEKIKDIIRSKKTNLPTLPVIVNNILTIAKDDRTSADNLAEFVCKDQAITNKILRLANSAYYGLMREVDSISRAISIIGFNEVISLTIGMSVISAFRQKEDRNAFNMRDFWIHSIGCAFASKGIAKKLGFSAAEQIFLNGLLHDTGKIIFALYFSEEYHEVIEEAKKSQEPLHRKEMQILGINHAALSGLLMEMWHFPNNLLLPSRFHHNPDKCPPKYEKQALIVEFADILCHNAGIGYSGNFVVPKPRRVIEKLRLDKTDMEVITEDLIKQRPNIDAFLELAH